MQIRAHRTAIAAAAILALTAATAKAQTDTNLNALQGLVPVSALANTLEGKAALGGNLAITGGIRGA